MSASDTPSVGGALTFLVNSSPLWASLNIGSAFMLLAGADVGGLTSVFSGAFAFHVTNTPSDTWWTHGSALCWCVC